MTKAMMAKISDNVAVALVKIDAGEKVSLILPSGEAIKEVVAKEDIPFAHKMAAVAIPKNDKIIRYGEVIGLATENIGEGNCVHIHNLKSERFAHREKLE